MEQASLPASYLSNYFYHRDTEYTERGIVESMKEAKAPASSSYQDYLIKSLKNPERAAGYISVMLELDQEGYNPVMFSSALEEVVEARKQLNNFSPRLTTAL